MKIIQYTDIKLLHTKDPVPVTLHSLELMFLNREIKLNSKF